VINNIFVIEKNGYFKIYQKFSYAEYVFSSVCSCTDGSLDLFLPNQSSLTGKYENSIIGES
jgi:hypothetical protein